MHFLSVHGTFITPLLVGAIDETTQALRRQQEAQLPETRGGGGFTLSDVPLTGPPAQGVGVLEGTVLLVKLSMTAYFRVLKRSPTHTAMSYLLRKLSIFAYKMDRNYVTQEFCSVHPLLP